MRKRALAAIHELRAMAHIVDMHQLTKDPESCFGPGLASVSTQRRPMTRQPGHCSITSAPILDAE